MIILDTDSCVALLRNRPTTARRKLNDALAHSVVPAVSTVTLFELWHGAQRSSRRQAAVREVEALVDFFDLLPVDGEDARSAGMIEAELRDIGQRIGPYDVLIAGQALRRQLTLITNNGREFARVAGLALENWLA